MMGEVIRVSGKAPDVGEFLKEAMLSQRFADVTLCCPGGQRFLAHRLVLSAASPYLQEVLLAHSKATTHCEPITVILAEVEAPELAAILGFVYTGSATVPRPRLDAFLRAADALHIRLPPVPIVMTCNKNECKQEVVKDVKISPKYLQCDQYPSCDGWYQPNKMIYNEHQGEKKESCPRRDLRRSTNEQVEISRDRNRDQTSPCQPRHDSTATHCLTFCQTGNIETIERDPRIDQRTSETLEKDQNELHDLGSNRQAFAFRFDRDNLHETPVQVHTSRCSSAAKIYPKVICATAPPIVRAARQDPLLDLSEAARCDRSEPARFGSADEEIVCQGSTIDSRGHLEDERFTECRENLASVIGGQGNPIASGNSPSAYSDRARPYERHDYGQTGEDLSCGESCCRWRTPRRHVANRVTASPWRQIVRPHHSPKIQPIVLQSHTDDNEINERLHVSEVPRIPALPVSPKETVDPMGNNSFYGYEVPTPCELTYCTNARPLDSPVGTETRFQDLHRPQMPFAPTQPIATVAPMSSVKNSESLFHAHSSVPTRLTGANESPQPIATSKCNYIGQATSQTTTKPELSHPVSRLCDTVKSEEKADTVVTAGVRKTAEAAPIDEKVVARIIANSDSNNNDAHGGNNAAQRGRSGQEDHKCDQCGKIFVTRASLKVHSRTHSGEKPFRCADCGKQFSQLRNYKYHRSIHEGTREFAATCPECGKYFNDRGYLSSHMKIHRNRKEYGCAECGKSFNQRVAYNMHVRIHTGVKPHQCEQCGKAFSRKMLLKQHLRTHSGERPYQCQVCQKAFADRSNMTLHTRLHSGLKPYQCTLCSKAFTKKHHLKTHLNYHTGTKPYSCPNCGLRFSQSSNMRTHFKKCSVNNPGGAKSCGVAAEGTNGTQDVNRGSAEVLTPPNSDQESSILTPISKGAPENNVT